MALYAFDGIGNEDAPDTDTGFDTNVLHFFRGYEDPDKDLDPTGPRGSLYLKGIGQRAETHTGSFVAKAFGIGGHLRIGIMMDRLTLNAEAGDTVVDVVGFSRGAALAISFCNELARKHPALAVRFLGLWEVVGELGVSGRLVNAGHDLRMPPNVRRCCHAMALDERRTFFQLTRLCGAGPADAERLSEVWFRGVHSDVGGGNGNFSLNWISLDWMFANAVRAGLPIDRRAIADNRRHASRPPEIREHKLAVGPQRPYLAADLLHDSVALDSTDPNTQRDDPELPARWVANDGTIRLG